MRLCNKYTHREDVNRKQLQAFYKLVTSLLQVVHKPSASLQKLANARQAFYTLLQAIFLQETFRLYRI